MRSDIDKDVRILIKTRKERLKANLHKIYSIRDEIIFLARCFFVPNMTLLM